MSASERHHGVSGTIVGNWQYPPVAAPPSEMELEQTPSKGNLFMCSASLKMGRWRKLGRSLLADLTDSSVRSSIADCPAIFGRLRTGEFVFWGLSKRRIALVGDRSPMHQLVSILDRANDKRITIVGMFWDEESCGPSRKAESDRNTSDLINLGKRWHLDGVVLAVPPTDKERLERLVHQLKALDIEIMLYSCADDPKQSTTQATHLAGVQMVLAAKRPLDRWELLVKAFVDKVFSLLVIIWLLPLMIMVAVAIKLDGPGPVLFRQKRYGKNNSEFDIFKFRTMTVAGSGELQTQLSDPRVTRVGRFLRRTSFDELPQLFNVLRGEMSLVGPRPHPIAMRTDSLLSEEIVSEYTHRHRVKPGITGWAQINGSRGATSTAAQVKRRVELDLSYIENWSIFLDIKILVLTPIRLILDRNGVF